MISLVLFARVWLSILPNFTQFYQILQIFAKFWQISTKPNIISPLNRCVFYLAHQNLVDLIQAKCVLFKYQPIKTQYSELFPKKFIICFLFWISCGWIVDIVFRMKKKTSTKSMLFIILFSSVSVFRFCCSVDSWFGCKHMV